MLGGWGGVWGGRPPHPPPPHPLGQWSAPAVHPPSNDPSKVRLSASPLTADRVANADGRGGSPGAPALPRQARPHWNLLPAFEEQSHGGGSLPLHHPVSDSDADGDGVDAGAWDEQSIGVQSIKLESAGAAGLELGRAGEQMVFQWLCAEHGSAHVTWQNMRVEQGLPYDLTVHLPDDNPHYMSDPLPQSFVGSS